MPAYTAVIADVVASRELAPRLRALLQADLRHFLLTLNQGYAGAIAAGFVITTGDEFQGLLHDPSILPDLVWAARIHLARARLRFGIGYGALHTALLPEAIGMDGPAFHHARDAITVARKKNWHGGVFRGFGPSQDAILDGLARLLERQADQMTDKQREVGDLLRDGLEQAEIATRLKVTRQAVSNHARAMGWDAFQAGESGLRAALAWFPALGSRR